MKRQTLHNIQQLKIAKEPITVLTAYDSSFAKLMSEEKIEIILVGDSLGMVIQGHQSTVPVSMENMQYHTRCVAAGNQFSLIVADLPYMSYSTEQESMANAAKLMQAGANMVKLEGGEWLCSTVSLLSERGVPVCAHLGLTPQSVDALGGFKIQGRDEEKASQILRDALAIEKAGAKLLVLECVPAALADKITQQLQIPTIGIGAGNKTDGQVLVLQDMLGMNDDFKPKFVKNFFDEPNVNSIQQAIRRYATAVKDRSFPAKEHSFE